MKVSFRDNQYDHAGDYLFPSVETKFMKFEIPEEAFLELYCDSIGLDTKYRKWFKFLLENKIVDVRYKKCPGENLNTLKELNKIKAFGSKLVYHNSTVYQVNPQFRFDLKKDNSFILEYIKE